MHKKREKDQPVPKRTGLTALKKSKSLAPKRANLLTSLRPPSPGVPQSKPNEPTPDFIVRGTVKNADDHPIPGALVQAFVRVLRQDQLLGKAETNARGEYLIRYPSAKSSREDEPSAPTPPLLVRALVNDQPIGDDVVRTNPQREETVDFKIPSPAPSEWEKLSTGIIPLLAGQGTGGQPLPPWEINDRDLDFLANDTGLEREKIRLWALAFAESRDATLAAPSKTVSSSVARRTTRAPSPLGLPESESTAAILYSWFRLGLPTEAVALWATPTERLLGSLTTAVAQRIVPSGIAADLDGVRTLVERTKMDRVLRAPALGTTTSLGELLGTLPAPLDLNRQRELAAVVTELRPDDPELMKRIAGIPGFAGKGVAPKVARTLRLAALTDGHAPLAQALQRRPQLAKESEGALLPLTTLRLDEWIDLAYTHGTPPGMSIPPEAYAEILAARIEQQHPNAALAAHLTAGRRLAQQPALAESEVRHRDGKPRRV
jgi:hypothetical protein